MIYIASALFLCQLFMALWNSYFFLYKQRKYTTQPLLVFYILTIALTVIHLQYMIWFFGQIIQQWIFANILMPVIKINIGLDHCWVMYELSLRVEQNIKRTVAMEKDQLAVSNDEPTANIDKKTEDFIRCGRIWVTAFIATNLTGVMAYSIWV